MTNKERVTRSIRHQDSDIVPYSLWLTTPARDRMVKFYHDPEFDSKIGNHIFAVGRVPQPGAQRFVKPGFFLDEFGVVWDRTEDPDIGVIREQIVTADNCATHPLPDPTDERCYAHIEKELAAHPDQFIIAGIGFSLFERAWTLAGMENVLVAFASGEPYIETLLDRLTEWLIAVVRRFGRYPRIDAIHLGDDWGQQHGLIMGPTYWRKYLKPRLAAVYGEIKKSGKFVSIHSCGDVREIFPDLIEIGLNVFNPFQPEVMDVHEMKRLYGNKLTFFGGISLQKTLAFGTPADVKEEVEDRLCTIGKGGGYIANACHSITKDVPAENIDMLIKTLQNQNKRRPS